MLKLQHLIPVAATALALAAPLAQAAPTSLLSEGFDNVADLAGKGWTLLNQSNPVGQTDWFQGDAGVFAAQSGAADSYVAANFNNATPGGAILNWLLTPELALSAGGLNQLTFATRTERGSQFADHLLVAFLDGVDSSFNVLANINGSESAGGYPDDWKKFTVTVGAGATHGRVAFAYVQANSDNANYIGIDSVNYIANITNNAVPEPESFGLVALALSGLLLSGRKAVAP